MSRKTFSVSEISMVDPKEISVGDLVFVSKENGYTGPRSWWQDDCGVYVLHTKNDAFFIFNGINCDLRMQGETSFSIDASRPQAVVYLSIDGVLVQLGDSHKAHDISDILETYSLIDDYDGCPIELDLLQQFDSSVRKSDTRNTFLCYRSEQSAIYGLGYNLGNAWIGYVHVLLIDSERKILTEQSHYFIVNKSEVHFTDPCDNIMSVLMKDEDSVETQAFLRCKKTQGVDIPDLLKDENLDGDFSNLFFHSNEVDTLKAPIFVDDSIRFKAYANIRRHSFRDTPSVWGYVDDKLINPLRIEEDPSIDLAMRKSKAILAFLRSHQTGLSPYDGHYYSGGTVAHDKCFVTNEGSIVFDPRGNILYVNLGGLYITPKTQEERDICQNVVNHHNLTVRLES